MENTDEKITPSDLIKLSDINTEITSTTQSILQEESPEKLKQLINLFNLQETKKSAVRTAAYHELLDKISDEMLTRFNKHRNEFTNDDMLKYLQAAHTAIDKFNQTTTEISETPISLINVTNVNIPASNEPALTREEREHIIEVLKLLKKQPNNSDNPEEIIIDETNEGETFNDGSK